MERCEAKTARLIRLPFLKRTATFRATANALGTHPVLGPDSTVSHGFARASRLDGECHIMVSHQDSQRWAHRTPTRVFSFVLAVVV